jgi:predicted phage-related endonuclease
MDRLERHRYIGGHDASALINRHQNRTPLDVYAKIVLKHAVDISEAPAIRRGNIVEPGLLDYLEQKSGKKFRRDVFQVDNDVPYFGCTMDAIDSDDLIYEVTSCTTWSLDGWGPDGTMRAKDHKYLQTQWELGITGYEKGEVVLFVTDTGEIRRYPFRRDDNLIGELRQAGEKFWFDHVMPEVPPTIAPHQMASTEIFDIMHKVASVEHKEPTDSLIDAAIKYHEVRAEENGIKDKKKAMSALLKQELGDAARSRWDGGSVSWTASKLKPAIDWKDVARALANHYNVSDEMFEEVIQQNTKERHSSRVLRVNIKKDKDNNSNNSNNQTEEANVSTS